MFIVWGSKRTVRKLGYVADFCPVCREPRSFQLSRVGSASHIYYISFGAGKLTGHIIECTDCGQALSTDPLRYPVYQKKPSADLEALIQETYPNLRSDYAARLATEAQVRRSPGAIPREQRAELILEPFALLNPVVEQRFTQDTQMDKQSGIGCLGTLLVLAVALTVGLNVREPLQSKVIAIGSVLFCIGVVYTFVQLGLGGRRFLRTKIVPKIARTLDPLEPTQEEITDCIHRCKAAGMKIGQKLKPEVLWAELRRRVEAGL